MEGSGAGGSRGGGTAEAKAAKASTSQRGGAKVDTTLKRGEKPATSSSKMKNRKLALNSEEEEEEEEEDREESGSDEEEEDQEEEEEEETSSVQKSASNPNIRARGVPRMVAHEKESEDEEDSEGEAGEGGTVSDDDDEEEEMEEKKDTRKMSPAAALKIPLQKEKGNLKGLRGGQHLAPSALQKPVQRQRGEEVEDEEDGFLNLTPSVLQGKIPRKALVEGENGRKETPQKVQRGERAGLLAGGKSEQWCGVYVIVYAHTHTAYTQSRAHMYTCTHSHTLFPLLFCPSSLCLALFPSLSFSRFFPLSLSLSLSRSASISHSHAHTRTHTFKSKQWCVVYVNFIVRVCVCMCVV